MKWYSETFWAMSAGRAEEPGDIYESHIPRTRRRLYREAKELHALSVTEGLLPPEPWDIIFKRAARAHREDFDGRIAARLQGALENEHAELTPSELEAPERVGIRKESFLPTLEGMAAVGMVAARHGKRTTYYTWRVDRPATPKVRARLEELRHSAEPELASALDLSIAANGGLLMLVVFELLKAATDDFRDAAPFPRSSGRRPRQAASRRGPGRRGGPVEK